MVSFEGPKSKGQYIYGKCTASSKRHKPNYIKERELLEQIRETLECITIPKSALPEIVKGLKKYHVKQQNFYKQRKHGLNDEYDDLERELRELFADRKQFKSRPDILESLINAKTSRQSTIKQQLENYANGNKSFLTSSLFLVDVCSRLQELFNPDTRTVAQRRYLLDFVFQNIQLNQKSLILPLKQPFKVLANKVNTSDWCRERDSNPRTRRGLVYSQLCLTASLSLHCDAWSHLSDSNRRPSLYKSVALATELRWHNYTTFKYLSRRHFLPLPLFRFLKLAVRA